MRRNCKIMVIYKFTFPNGKIYIGQTVRVISIRIGEHKKDYCNKNDGLYNTPFYKAIREYGWENLIWDVIDVAETFKELDDKERKWILFYNSCIFFKNSNGYNSNLGGVGNNGHKHKQESIDKIKVSSSGENNTNSKLSEKNIFEIINLKKEGIKQNSIAKIFNVKEGIISKILSGRAWSTVTNIKYSKKHTKESLQTAGNI